VFCSISYYIIVLATLFIIAVVIKTCTRHAIKPSAVKFIDGGPQPFIRFSATSYYNNNKMAFRSVWTYIKIVRCRRGERADVETAHPTTHLMNITEAELDAGIRMTFITFQLWSA